MKKFMVFTQNGSTQHCFVIEAISKAQARKDVLAKIKRDSHVRVGRGQPESLETITLIKAL